jgi:protein ImuA
MCLSGAKLVLALFLFCSIVTALHIRPPMTQPTASSVERNRAAVAEELRRLLPKMEGVRTVSSIPFGLAAIDRHLPQGGLSGGALHEVVPEAGAMPAAFGFLVALLRRISSPPAFSSPSPCGEGMGVGVERRHSAKTGVPVSMRALPPDPPPYPPPQGGREQTRTRPLLLVLPAYGLRDYGRPHGHGLNALGLSPHRLILAETAHRRDTLWAMEEALHSCAVAAVAGFIDQLDLKTSQRLQLAAADCGLPLLLLRPAELLEASAAATRWRVGTAAAARDRFGLFARARWRLALERCRNGRTGEWMVEYDHVAHRFSLAAALADPAVSRRASETGKPSFRRAG